MDDKVIEIRNNNGESLRIYKEEQKKKGEVKKAKEDKKVHSPVDEAFHDIFGYYPAKAGEAMEKLTDAAYQIAQSVHVKHNQFLPGQYGNTKYQIDGLVETKDGNQQMIEAKDYTINGKKVGRGDLQKQEGALADLPMEKGIFASATDYTKDAKEYAKGTHINPRQVGIDLYHVRPSKEEDEKGRIKIIEIRMHAKGLAFDRAKWKILFTKETVQFLHDKYPKGYIGHLMIDNFYDASGKVKTCMHDITIDLNKKVDFKDEKQEKVEGRLDLPSCFIKYNGDYLEVKGIEYGIPIYNDEMTFTVTADGKPKILIKSEDGSVDKLITDEEIKKVLGKDGKGK